MKSLSGAKHRNLLNIFLHDESHTSTHPYIDKTRRNHPKIPSGINDLVDGPGQVVGDEGLQLLLPCNRGVTGQWEGPHHRIGEGAQHR